MNIYYNWNDNIFYNNCILLYDEYENKKYNNYIHTLDECDDAHYISCTDVIRTTIYV